MQKNLRLYRIQYNIDGERQKAKIAAEDRIQAAAILRSNLVQQCIVIERIKRLKGKSDEPRRNSNND